MKKKSFLFLCGCLMAATHSVFAINTVLKGTLDDYPGTGYLLLGMDGSHDYDTIQVEKDGRFSIALDIDKNTTRYIDYMYLGEKKRNGYYIYLKSGKTLQMDVKGMYQKQEFLGEMKEYYHSVATYKGESKKECEYLALSQFANYKYKNEDGSFVTFKNFKKQVADFQKSRLDKLKGTCEEFKAEKTAAINAIPDTYYFVYSRFLRNGGDDAGKDKDFMAFINSIDINDVDSYKRGLTDGYVEFMTRRNPGEYAQEPTKARFFCYLRDHIKNKEVCAAMADTEMSDLMASGDNQGLVRAFEVYRQCSDSGKRFEENLRVYNSISKLLPGVQATDFVMKDVAGNPVRFRSVIGQGKVTYIDFWATWCAPCCDQIPYVEKLVEKYKDNPKLEFVSISLDNNLKRWRDKLEKDKPQWMQYVIPDNFNSEFAKEYNIRAIPRFMVFDAEGKIITIDAPRPSTENIEEILNGYLK